MAAMGLSAQAQLMRSTTFYEKERVPATWYLRAGMSVNNVAGANTFSEETDGSIGSKIGYDVAVGFQKSIKDRGFYWGMEFGLGTGGAKNEMETESSYVYKQSYVAHNIKLTPLLFGYKYAFQQRDRCRGNNRVVGEAFCRKPLRLVWQRTRRNGICLRDGISSCRRNAVVCHLQHSNRIQGKRHPSAQNGFQEAESGRDKRSKWCKGKLMGSTLVEKYVSL